jgi:flagellar biosynthetic protein FliP
MKVAGIINCLKRLKRNRGKNISGTFLIFLFVSFLILVLSSTADALTLPTLQIGLGEATSPRQVSVLIEILLLFTVLSVAPAILLMTTCFTRLIIAFSF